MLSQNLKPVKENTPPYKLPIYRQATTDNLNRKITILQEGQINWTNEIENMDTRIKHLIDFLALTKKTKNGIKLQNQNKINNDEETNVREWTKQLDYFMYIYNVDNLLKFAGK